MGGVQVKEGEETRKVCDFCTMCSEWYMLNDTLTIERTTDLGFPLANRKGQREYEDGTSGETVEVRVETGH